MDLDHTAWYVNQHHINIKKLKRRQDQSINLKAVNPLIVFSAVLGFQTAKHYMGKGRLQKKKRVKRVTSSLLTLQPTLPTPISDIRFSDIFF